MTVPAFGAGAWPRLCAILDEETAGRTGWTLPGLAEAYLAGGATLLQLRAKRASSGWLLDTATRIQKLALGSQAIVIINDRADIARLADAAGVHVGQDDVPAGAAREIIGAERIVGLSTHTPEQLESALAEPISYVAVGPVFPSSTKATGYEPLGTAGVARAAARIRSAAGAGILPLVAIGGITLDTASDVIEAGADVVAVIGDLLSTGDPQTRARDFLRRLADTRIADAQRS